MSSWENDQGHVESGRHSCAPIDCARSRPSCRWSEYHSWGPLWLPVLPKGSTCPSGETEMRRRGGRAPLMTLRVLERDGEMSPETSIMPEASLQGSGEIEFVVR
jgi:hypothetical protein